MTAIQPNFIIPSYATEKKEKKGDIVLCSISPNEVKALNANLKMSPKEALEWIAVMDAIGGLVAKYGTDILNVFKPKELPPQNENKNETSFEIVA